MSDRETGGSRDDVSLLYESIPDDGSWAFLWSGSVRCMCGGIRTTEAQCCACGGAWLEPIPLVIRDTDGNEDRVTCGIGASPVDGPDRDLR